MPASISGASLAISSDPSNDNTMDVIYPSMAFDEVTLIFGVGLDAATDSGGIYELSGICWLFLPTT